jgi:hypothetical protein
VAKWEEAKAGFWNAAVKGSEALRTAIGRAVKNEVCVELNKPAVQICWDMEKFYDTIEPGLVAKEGRKLGYPIKELYIGILIHRSSRILRAKGGISRYITPGCSILAGCMQSTAWARVVLYDLLEAAHYRFALSIQSWVDDLIQRSHGMHNGQGQRQQVIEASIGAGSRIAKGMALKGCKVSGSKSVILATDPELASLVQAGISKEAGILLPIVQMARDLGIDSGFSKRRRILTACSRVKKSSAKLKKLLQLSKITTKARILFRTGVVPHIAWGQEAKGLAPTVVSDQLWAKAASSYLGKGAEQGIDWHLTFPTLKKLRGKKGNPKAAGALEAAMQGAWWFGSRLLDLGLDQANQWCQWCHDNKGLQEADTPAHGIWTCPRWRGCEAGPATKDSQDIVEQAEEGAQHNPIFWFRGLVPKGWAKEILEGWEPTFETQAGGCLEEVSSSEPYAMKEGDIMATDGSGGCYPTNTILRRVGWGLSLAKTKKRRRTHRVGQ